MSTPLISVIIPSYNRAHVIEKSARSVLAQTFADFELLIIDDGSSDNTRQVVEGLQDDRVRYVYQENAGACAARNHGIALAQGEYIAFHDSDDLWYPDKLEKQLHCIVETGSDIVICKLAMCHPDGSKTLFPKRVGEGFITLEDDIFGFGTQNVFARREVLEHVLFDPAMPRYQDMEWLYRAMKNYRAYCMDIPLVDYIIGEDSISVNYNKMLCALELFSRKHPEVVKNCPVISMHALRNLLEGYLKQKNAAPGQRKRFLQMMRWYYPGLVPFAKSFLNSRRKQKAHASTAQTKEANVS